jgi:hypothetical protein
MKFKFKIDKKSPFKVVVYKHDKTGERYTEFQRPVVGNGRMVGYGYEVELIFRPKLHSQA